MSKIKRARCRIIPGPYRVRKWTKPLCNCGFAKSDYYDVLGKDPSPGVDHELVLANGMSQEAVAYLFCASPDLLSAAEAVFVALTGPTKFNRRACIELLRAAIAKVEAPKS
jgi:hypothetical protein